MPKVGEVGIKEHSKSYMISEDPLCLIHHGDCLRIMPTLEAGFADLIFADPPFNVGYHYDEYDDNLSDEKYMSWTADWLKQVKRLLKSSGSIFVASGLKYQAHIRVLMDQIGFKWQDTICWHYTFGPSQKKKLTPSWVAIHHAVLHPDAYFWNQKAVTVPSARQVIYKDKRAKEAGKAADNTWVLLPAYEESCFREDQNAWLLSRVCGTFKERTKHPCQMPEAVLDRILRMACPSSGVVFDPFMGSGTTAAAAVKLGRGFVGCELSNDYVNNIIRPRLQEMTK